MFGMRVFSFLVAAASSARVISQSDRE